jgi:hypothetical protein
MLGLGTLKVAVLTLAARFTDLAATVANANTLLRTRLEAEEDLPPRQLESIPDAEEETNGRRRSRLAAK